MTVRELKEYLNQFDERADVFYFDNESSEDRPLMIDWLTIEDSFEDRERERRMTSEETNF